MVLSTHVPLKCPSIFFIEFPLEAERVTNKEGGYFLTYLPIELVSGLL